MDKGKIDFEILRDICDEFEAGNKFIMDKNTHISDAMLNAFLQAMDLDGKEILDVE